MVITGGKTRTLSNKAKKSVTPTQKSDFLLFIKTHRHVFELSFRAYFKHAVAFKPKNGG
jgi:hypothetical protein